MPQARDNSNDLRDKYSFKTEVINNAIFYFEIQGDEPVKLGDGTFGVVYQAYNEALEKFAVKLLYENQSLDQATVQPVLTNNIINSFREQFKLQNEDPVLEKIKAFQKPIGNLSSFTFGILRTGIDEAQYTFLLDLVLKNFRSVAVARFIDEIKAAKEIRQNLHKLSAKHTENPSFEGIVATLGGTENFRSSAAYMNLKAIFQASHVKVSDYALVMPLYPKTLKELLEEGIGKYYVRKSPKLVETVPEWFPSGNASSQQVNVFQKEELEEKIASLDNKDGQEKIKIIKENTYELVGYDILKSMEFKERISTILPYLIETVIGINVLYAAKLSHLDLKPANIFVKETQKVGVVIGDLGFLKPEKAADATIMSSVRDYLPLGTRHYRSPEQKEYFDICNVEIRQDRDDSGNTRASIVVRDPKFRDTIIEESDYLVFSKDAARVKYEIKEITKKNDDSTVITLAINDETHEKLKPEKQTQIILYKRQAIRTDLFGLGAIAFDMVTCGESPERFYDNIRAYDAEETDLDNLMQLYRAVSSFQSSEPRLVHVFAPLKHQQSSKYAPPDIVELILKCMLYKAKQTFYDANKGLSQQLGNYNPTMKAVLDYLTNLSNDYQPIEYNNPLKTGTLTRSKETHSSILSQRIKELQKLSLEKLPLRLAQGIWYFKKLVEFVRKTITDKQIFFSELLPENIILNQNSMDFSYVVYQNETDYKNDLKNDSVYTKLVRNIANPYVPDYITFLRRSISLNKIPQANSFRYAFSDSSLLGDHVSVGDWIIINSHAWRIATVSNYEITLKDEKGNQVTDLPTPNDISISYIYYKNIDPCTHYLSMLGIYLYQIFFVGLGDATVDKPLIINIAKSRLYMMKNGSEDVKIKNFSIKEQNAQRIADPIFQFITQMYVKLTFFEDKNSFYKEKRSDNERIIAIASEVEKLQVMIESFVEVDPTTLNELIKDSQIKSLKSKEKIFDSFPQKLEFNELINSLLTIQLSSSNRTWW